MVFKTSQAAPAPIGAGTSMSQPPLVQAGAGGVGPAPDRSDGITIDLTKPLNTHKGETRRIFLRSPTLADYIELGDIDVVFAKGVDESGKQPEGMEVRTNYDAIMRWAVRLSDLDRVILGALNPQDAGVLVGAVRKAVVPFSKGNS